MLIALDYDATYTIDPLFWDQVIELGRERGHAFICVTGRREPPGAHEHRIPIKVVCAGSTYKRDAAAKLGLFVDVWIDDMPDTVMPSRMLTFD